MHNSTAPYYKNDPTVPSYMYTFVGMDYYCESAVPYKFTKTLYSNDSLWDGQQCNGNEGPCCTDPKMT